jgi:hypothetical protein
MYSSTLPLTSALDGVGGQCHAPAVLPPGKAQYPLYRRLGGPQGRSGQVQEISPPTGIRSPDRPARSKSLYRLSYPAIYVTEKAYRLESSPVGVGTIISIKSYYSKCYRIIKY